MARSRLPLRNRRDELHYKFDYDLNLDCAAASRFWLALLAPRAGLDSNSFAALLERRASSLSLSERPALDERDWRRRINELAATLGQLDTQAVDERQFRRQVAPPSGHLQLGRRKLEHAIMSQVGAFWATCASRPALQRSTPACRQRFVWRLSRSTAMEPSWRHSSLFATGAPLAGSHARAPPVRAGTWPSCSFSRSFIRSLARFLIEVARVRANACAWNKSGSGPALTTRANCTRPSCLSVQRQAIALEVQFQVRTAHVGRSSVEDVWRLGCNSVQQVPF